MSDIWDEFQRSVDEWQEKDDIERLELFELLEEGFAFQETEPEASFVLFTKMRDEARRLNEGKWLLLAETYRLVALTCYVADYTRALPLAIDLMVRFNSSDGLTHPFRGVGLSNALLVYTCVDPFGYQDEIERGFAYVRKHISDELESTRFLIDEVQMYCLESMERWGEAYDIGVRSLSKVLQIEDRNWYGSSILNRLCPICHALGHSDELAGHAEYLSELAHQAEHLRRMEANAWLWLATVQRGRGDEREASRSFRRSVRILKSVERRDWICSDSMAAYHEANGDWKEAVAVRDREITALANRGMHHRVCQAHVERCRLLKKLGVLANSDLAAARVATSCVRSPEWFLNKLDRIERNGTA